jgi:hypothetical protein
VKLVKNTICEYYVGDEGARMELASQSVHSHWLFLRNRHRRRVTVLGFLFDPEDGGSMSLQNWLTFTGLHSIISQKTENSSQSPL